MRVDIASVRDIPDMHTLGHTCANINGELLVVWGGTNDRVGKTNVKNSSIWIYETLTGYWRHRTCSGECPPYMSGCASCLIGQKMYIFGGHWTAPDKWLDCLYCLDLETFIWVDAGARARAQPTKPLRCDKNVAWSYEGKLYIFGGYGLCQIEHYLELLDRQKDLQLVPDQRWSWVGWNNQLVEYDPADKTWRWPSYSGKCPSARAAYAGALMAHKFFVFGGRDGYERLNDLHTLDMRTFTWQKVAAISNDPSQSIQRTLAAPIRHLLEGTQGGRASEQPALLAAPANSNANDHQREQHEAEELVDDGQEAENHRQIVEEMQGVGVEEEDDEEVGGGGDEERWNLGASSQMDISAHSESDTHDSRGAPTNQQQQDFNDNDDDFEYPRPSHLLERWSIASSNNSSHHPDQSNLIECTEAHATQQVSQLLQLPDNSPATQSVSQLDRVSQSRTDDDDDDDEDDNDNDEDAQQAGARVQECVGPDGSDSDELDGNQQQLVGAEEELRNEELAPGAQPAIQPADQDLALGAANTNHQQTPSSIPAGRSFCSLTPISANQMLLFGGVDSQDQILNDCWLFNTTHNRWTQIEYTKSNHKLMRPRLWHTGARTKQNEIVILGGSDRDTIDTYCTDLLLISFEPRSLKRLALDTVSRAVRMKTIQRERGIPSTLMKQIKLRKQAIALTTYRPDPASQQVR